MPTEQEITPVFKNVKKQLDEAIVDENDIATLYLTTTEVKHMRYFMKTVVDAFSDGDEPLTAEEKATTEQTALVDYEGIFVDGVTVEQAKQITLMLRQAYLNGQNGKAL